MSSTYYRDLEMQLRGLRQQALQTFDRPDHSTARVIERELQKAEDMAQTSQNLRSIGAKLDTARRLVKQSQHASDSDRVMDVNDSVAFDKTLYNVHESMKRHPHY